MFNVSTIKDNDTSEGNVATMAFKHLDLKVASKTIVDIGAGDGLSLSNSRCFALAGFKCFLIEPNPLVFPKLQNRYKNFTNVITIEACVYDTDGYVQLTSHKNDNGPSSRNMGASIIMPKKNIGKHTWSVRSLKLQTFFGHYNITSCDILSVDTEGYDREILKSLIDGSVRPQIIISEMKACDVLTCYRLVRKRQQNFIYILDGGD